MFSPISPGTIVNPAARARNSVGARGLAFAAQWQISGGLPSFAGVLTDANARLGADVDRYSFIVLLAFPSASALGSTDSAASNKRRYEYRSACGSVGIALHTEASNSRIALWGDLEKVCAELRWTASTAALS
jgi:hypothetical protein